ncbi:TIGR02234 family membrane protein [Streptomyces sp. HNM0575]|uniref:TIGR02234 family membrane protein n=1 Tax=Streptomyces sp. HNM0575 TaxID=2716338 RepID=UPI00145CE737|nr:TIGR02234 family membrane protein [Streptomyces sp. HNM0575]
MTSVPPARPSDAEQGGPAPDAAAPAAGSPGPAAAGSQGAPVRVSARAARRALAFALLSGAVGAALALLASGQVWSHATASFAQGELPVKAKGGDVTGLPSALALVGLAALVAVFAVKRAGRVLVAALLALCGTGTLAAALLSADDTAALEEKAARASGLARTGVDAVQVSAWPYVSAAGGLLLLVAGVLALRYGPAWPSMSGSARYERTERAPRRPRTGAAAAPVDPDRPEEMWKALDRGEDPTGEAARTDGAGGGTSRPGPSGSHPESPPESPPGSPAGSGA